MFTIRGAFLLTLVWAGKRSEYIIQATKKRPVKTLFIFVKIIFEYIQAAR
jgi:hypothetical protein